MSAFLNSDSLSPHGFCLLWRPELLWTHVVADALIGLAYTSIPFALAIFVRKRGDVAFGWVFWCFVLFILACGMTHFMSIWTLWHADYGIEALVKVVTAAASVSTAFLLWPLLPKALALPSPEQMRRVNVELEGRVRERDAAMEALERETQERLNAETQLFHARKMEALGQLTGGIAHDFNNLLMVIRGASEMLQREDLPEARRLSYLKGIEDSAARAARLTSQLLTFARRQPVKAQIVDVNQNVDAMTDLLRQTLAGHIEIALDLSSDLRRVNIDPTQLELAVLNVAVNARDAMPDGGRLTITTRNVDDHMVEIAIADTGVGMDPATLERAFEPFFTTKPVGKGTGLGLAQVYGFAAQSEGEARIVSAPGAGTVVVLRLPGVAADAGDPPALSGAEPKFAPGGVCLVVEDNPAVANFVEGLVADLGFRPIVAANAEEALRIVERPRAAISDIVMPGMNGVDLAKALEARFPGLPIVLATGYSNVELGADTPWPVLQKPFSRGELVRALNVALAVESDAFA